MSAWLHMGGAPARTTITLTRRTIPARRLRVNWCPLWNAAPRPHRAGQTPFDWMLGGGGLGAALALLRRDPDGLGYDFDALARDAADLAVRADQTTLARAGAERLEAGGVPRASGVFSDEDAADTSDVRVATSVAFAILLRRSGPLFMPGREPQLSLVVPKVTTLIFPEVCDGELD